MFDSLTSQSSTALKTEIYVTVTRITSCSFERWMVWGSHPSSRFHFQAGLTSVPPSHRIFEALDCVSAHSVSRREFQVRTTNTASHESRTLQIQRLSPGLVYREIPCLTTVHALKTVAVCSSETLGSIFKSTRRCYPEAQYPHFPVHCFSLHLRFVYEKTGWKRDVKELTSTGQINSSDKLFYSLMRRFPLNVCSYSAGLRNPWSFTLRED